MSTSDLRITSAFKASRNRWELFVQEGSTVTAVDGVSGFGTLNGSKLVPPTTRAFALIWTSGTATRGLSGRTSIVASHYLDANFHNCRCGAATKVTEA